MIAQRTASKQRGRPFPKGRSGNPAGRPPGARNAATVLAEQLMDGEAEGLTRKVIEVAKGGDVVALRICLDRILPPRERPVRFKLPDLRSASDAAASMAAIANAVASGDLMPSEAAELSVLVSGYAKAVELAEIEKRLQAIEQKQIAMSSR